MKDEFNQKAREWDLDPDKLDRAQKFALEIKNSLLSRTGITSAMEFGCGTAQVSFNLAHNLNKVLLVDNSDGMMQVVREKIQKNNTPHFTTKVVNLPDEDIPDQKFDLIYSLMSLHHVTDLEKILKKFYQLLENGGYLCIGDLEKEDGSFHHFSDHFTGHFGFDRTELARIMNNAGLEEKLYKVFYELKRESASGPDHQTSVKKYPLFFSVYQKT